MADSRHGRYGRTNVDVASVQQFVMGYQAKEQQKVKDFYSALAVGLTAAAISAYGSRLKRR